MKTRIFFASDVHGSESCFRKFINAAKFYDANALILGGDITGKALVPIVEMPDGRFRLSFEGEEVVVKKEELPTYIKTLRNSGRYCFMATEAELAELEKDKAKLDALFLKSMKEVLRSWISLAQERLKGTGVKCYISPGNDDRLELDELLQDSENVVNPEAKVVELESGNEMITVGYANPTPWKSPREVPEDELFRMIDGVASQLKEPSKSIFNLHVPPHGTELDKAPVVNSELKYEREGLGQLKMTNIGSTAVRKSIEKYQPMLGLHGHVHEVRGFIRIGRTLCVSPGSDYVAGTLKGAIIDLEGSAIKEYMLTSG